MRDTDTTNGQEVDPALIERLNSLERQIAELNSSMPDLDVPEFPRWRARVDALLPESNAILEELE